MRSTCKESYSGPRPFSEEESKVQIRAVDCPVVSCLMVGFQALRRGISEASERTKLVGYFSIHCCIQKLFSPYGISWKKVGGMKNNVRKMLFALCVSPLNPDLLNSSDPDISRTQKSGETSALFSPKEDNCENSHLSLNVETCAKFLPSWRKKSLQSPPSLCVCSVFPDMLIPADKAPRAELTPISHGIYGSRGSLTRFPAKTLNFFPIAK